MQNDDDNDDDDWLIDRTVDLLSCYLEFKLAMLRPSCLHPLCFYSPV